jgi:anti-sigma B factor antagonist
MLGSDELPENAPPSDPTVFRVEMESIDTSTAWDLRPALLKTLYTDGPRILIDLGRVSFIDSTGLGMLVGVLKEAREMQGDVKLINAGREVRRILQVTGLEALFELGPGATGPP